MNHGDMVALITSVATRVAREYPEVEIEELIGQGWLILTEDIELYDESRGVKLSTFLYSRLYGGLRDFVRRYYLKEQNLNGMRVPETYHESIDEVSLETQVESKLMIEHIIQNSFGISRRVVECMAEGLSQSETASKLGISRQRVGKILKVVRDKYEADKEG